MRLVSIVLFAGLLVAACAPRPPLGRVENPGGPGVASQPKATAAAALPPADRAATPTPGATLSAAAPGETPAATLPPTPAPSATPTADPLEGFQICSPLSGILLEDLPRLISDGYHPPAVYYSDARHPAIDIAFYRWKDHHQIAGTPVQSVLPGRIAAAETGTFPMGNVVIVETRAEQIPAALRAALDMADGRSLYTLYAHMQEDSLLVERGQAVTPCAALGKVGKTGNTLAAHLHLEARLGPRGVSFSGFQGYIEEATEREKANYRAWSTSGEFRHFDPLRLLLYEIGYPPTPGSR